MHSCTRRMLLWAPSAIAAGMAETVWWPLRILLDGQAWEAAEEFPVSCWKLLRFLFRSQSTGFHCESHRRALGAENPAHNRSCSVRKKKPNLRTLQGSNFLRQRHGRPCAWTWQKWKSELCHVCTRSRSRRKRGSHLIFFYVMKFGSCSSSWWAHPHSFIFRSRPS